MGDKVKVRGIYGKIVYETKNTFVIETNGSYKVIPKKGNLFIKDKEKYSGDNLIGRIWERLDP